MVSLANYVFLQTNKNTIIIERPGSPLLWLAIQTDKQTLRLSQRKSGKPIAQRFRRWTNIAQMLYKCFVFTG